MQDKVFQAIDTMNKAECLKFLELHFNELGLRNIIGYFTVESMSGNESPEDKQECRDYLTKIRLAKKLTK